MKLAILTVVTMLISAGATIAEDARPPYSDLGDRKSAVPDFSKGMPDVNLVGKLKIKGQETFSFKTALNTGDFSIKLSNFLGAGWRKRTLNPEEMSLAASMGQIANAEANLSVYENAKIPGVDIRVIHLKDKEGKAESRVEIHVLRSGPLVRDFGSSMSPDGTKRLEVIRRDGDLVDFEVFDAASGNKLASDSIGWSAMRWFLYWETPSRLWGYGSDIQYFKLFEFRADGTVVETDVDESMFVPSVVWDNLPSSLQKKYTAEEDDADEPATDPKSKSEGKEETKP
ncbi:hypothetical protein NG895_09030 [Aeoliella sp. ICT_H6.2]|uniref:Outer membrane lipoprotein-sorting protein n=1 Tax=Aeoliella straminimaris TaxID=2954799 RepID=A0A9X2JFU0_9BACT|nr:hypothetical protein [Aeoliella straminimaris]MCO6044051.1 hypothetical protein [Aeoliella straminimaris]